MANSVNPDEMPHSVTSHLGLHCLLRPLSEYLQYIWYSRSDHIHGLNRGAYRDKTNSFGHSGINQLWKFNLIGLMFLASYCL